MLNNAKLPSLADKIAAQAEEVVVKDVEEKVTKKNKSKK